MQNYAELLPRAELCHHSALCETMHKFCPEKNYAQDINDFACPRCWSRQFVCKNDWERRRTCSAPAVLYYGCSSGGSSRTSSSSAVPAVLREYLESTGILREVCRRRAGQQSSCACGRAAPQYQQQLQQLHQGGGPDGRQTQPAGA